MHPPELFAASESIVDRIVAGVCRRARLTGADAEDFASDVKVALLDGDFAILREFEGRSSLQGYLSVVIERLYYDQRTRRFGRWNASAHAERAGPATVLLEKLLCRDHRALEQAIPIVQAAHPGMTAEEIAKIAEQLPERTSRPRAVALDEVVAGQLVSSDSADARALDHDAGRIANRTSAIVRRTLDELSPEDRMIVRFRFGSSLTIAQISRLMRLPQRPLYRRIDSLLAEFRRALTEAGIDAATVAAVIGRELNFGLTGGENGQSQQSDEDDDGHEPAATAGETP